MQDHLHRIPRESIIRHQWFGAPAVGCSRPVAPVAFHFPVTQWRTVMFKQILFSGALALAASGGFSHCSFAGPNANAKILLHLLAPTTKNACTRSQATPDCSGIVTAGGLSPQSYFAYLLVTDADSAAGIAGVQCGVAYNDTANAGVDIYSWTSCATIEFQSTGWPASGGGNLVTWDASTKCQRFQSGGPGTGVLAVAGYFYCASYGQDTLRVTTRPIDNAAKIAACSSNEDVVESTAVQFNPSHLGYAVFSPLGQVPGYSPCGLGGGGELRVPGGGDDNAELWSSGYDPTLGQRLGATWPFTVKLGKDKAVVVGDIVYLEGDSISFDFDPGTRALHINGSNVLRRAASEPTSMSPEPPQIVWQRAFLDSLDQLRAGHLKTTLDVVAFATQAIRRSPSTIVDKSYTPRIGNTSAIVQFVGDALPTIIQFARAPTQTSSLADVETAFRRQVLGHIANITSHYPYVLATTTQGISVMGGTTALESIGVINRALSGGLRSNDQARADSLGLGALDHLTRAMRGDGRVH